MPSHGCQPNIAEKNTQRQCENNSRHSFCRTNSPNHIQQRITLQATKTRNRRFILPKFVNCYFCKSFLSIPHRLAIHWKNKIKKFEWKSCGEIGWCFVDSSCISRTRETCSKTLLFLTKSNSIFFVAFHNHSWQQMNLALHSNIFSWIALRIDQQKWMLSAASAVC